MTITIQWPGGVQTQATPGTDWLVAAQRAGVVIPTGCLGGSCGACEIEVNGEVLRACIATVPPGPSGAGSSPSNSLKVELATDPYW